MQFWEWEGVLTTSGDVFILMMVAIQLFKTCMKLYIMPLYTQFNKVKRCLHIQNSWILMLSFRLHHLKTIWLQMPLSQQNCFQSPYIRSIINSQEIIFLGVWRRTDKRYGHFHSHRDIISNNFLAVWCFPLAGLSQHWGFGSSRLLSPHQWEQQGFDCQLAPHGSESSW